MSLDKEALETQIPQYLTATEKDALVAAIKQFTMRKKVEYYTTHYAEELLQGDCWSQLEAYDFKIGELRGFKGVVLSNSCDIDTANKRFKAPSVVFAPIISVAKYQNFLVCQGFAGDAINSHISDIRNQYVTSTFFMPQGAFLEEDYIALLDMASSVPRERFEHNIQRKKYATLSQFGFYLFVFKLSVHFCRFKEDLHRHEPTITQAPAGLS